MNPFSPTTSLVMASCKLCGGLTGSELPSSVSLVLAPGAMAQPSQKCKPSRASWECLPFRFHRASALLCSRQNAPPPISSSGSDFLSPGPSGLPGDPKPFEERASSEIRSGVLGNYLPQKKTKALVCSVCRFLWRKYSQGCRL